MLRQLILMSAAFHVLNVAALIFVARLWRHRHAEEPAIRPRLPQIVGDLGVLGSFACLSAAGVGVLGRADGFGIINLLSQWIFGELLVLLMLAAYWLRRDGSRLKSAAFAAVTAVLVGIFIDAHYVEPRALSLEEHSVDLKAKRGARAVLVSHSEAVAQGPSELRIAHLSDIQTAVIGSHERRAFREAMAMEPDLILLTGDYLQVLAGHENLDKAREDFRTLLRGLRGARLGVYAVKGDTEGPDWPSLVSGTPVVPLTDESLRLPFPGSPSGFVSLLGLSPGMARGRNGKTLRRLVKQLPAGDLKIVFGHSPDFIMSLDENIVDLALAGHTHGGQIVLPFFGPPMTLSRLPRRMARGLHFWNGTPLHVSAGVGMERELAPQVRFLCRPEVCLLRVKV